MSIRIFHVDAFTDLPFAGNPAAVCLLDRPRDAKWMQAVAAEMALSETAFVRATRNQRFDLRWFTPAVEVELCGHATLASAHVLWQECDIAPTRTIRFSTSSRGELAAKICQHSGAIELDFPALEVLRTPVPGLAEALGIEPIWIGRSRDDTMVELPSVRHVRDLVPDFDKLRTIEARGTIVTAAGDGDPADFVSRFFAPAVGVAEDPVTGSAHCVLGPYWGRRLDKTEVIGQQLSSRGGTVKVVLRGDRVALVGRAVTLVRGELLC